MQYWAIDLITTSHFTFTLFHLLLNANANLIVPKNIKIMTSSSKNLIV